MQVPFYLVILFSLVISIIEFFALKMQIGFKNELAAKYYLYQIVITQLTLAFVLAGPFNFISSTFQYILSIILLVVNLIIAFVIEKKKNLVKKQ